MHGNSILTSVARIQLYAVLLWLPFVCLVSNASAQYKVKPQDFRIFNGKLYNVEQSQLWKTTVTNLTEDCDNCTYEFWNSGIVVTTTKFPIVANKQEQSAFIPGRYYNVPVKDSSRPVTNGLYYLQFADMEVRSITKIIPNGKTNYNGQVISAYSVGLPNTAENRKTLVK